MNRKLAFVFSFLTLAGASSFAFANEQGTRNTDPACVEKHAERRDGKLAKFDTNKDGKLDDVERAAMKASWQEKRAERIARFDLNKDGKLDESERAAMRNEFVGKMFAKLDVNKDGQLTVDEVKCTRLEKEFAAVDTDKSGTLSMNEVAAAKPMMHFGHHGRRGQRNRNNFNKQGA